ncbi:MAG: AAA family ATPase, partial [Anaerolineales bacterium]|nr:AAA family ATPase [Anaerolineales bacterium]
MSERSPLLQLHLLGTPRVEQAGQPHRIVRRQVRALLYYLADCQGPVARELLATLFWPDMATAQALRQLTQLLTHLRRQLPTPEMLLTIGDAIVLAPEQIWVDVSVLTDLATGRSSRRCRQAEELYRGPFLDGFHLLHAAEFESWLLTQRHRYQQIYLECLANRVERSAAFGDIPDAVHSARQYLQIDDLAEGMHRRLIELYAAAGDEAAARRQYELCKRILARELAIEPLAGTTQALQRALQPAERPLLTLPPAPDRPVVGREAELECFATGLKALQRGRGGLILLSGERGSGKSTLLHACARHAAGERLTLYTRCLSPPLPLFGPLFGPLADLLRAFKPQDSADLCRL